ncbi:MAG: NAD-dependent epimerase/dehydratase family protein [Planctomycetales bacterium]
MPSETVLITGGAGFIGSHTADALAARGYRIRILDNLQGEVHGGKWPKYLSSDYEKIKGDVRDKAAWEKALAGVSAVYHLAAYQDQRLDFSRFFTTNAVSTALLYECLVEQQLSVRNVILASSHFVYGDGEYSYRAGGGWKTYYPPLRTLEQFENGEWEVRGPRGQPAQHIPFRETQPVFPTNSYGLSKYTLELAALRLGQTYAIPTVALRYSIVQGERQSPRNLYSGAMRIFVSQALSGVPITVYEDGLARRDFVNIRDVVAANVLALTDRRMDHQVFNVGAGRAYTVLQFARAVQRLTGTESQIVLGGFRRTDTRHAVSDVTRLKRLGWKPQYTIDDSIRSYADWFLAEGWDKKVDRQALLGLQKGIRR